MIFGTNKKIDGVPLFGGKRSCLNQGLCHRLRMDLEVGTLLLSNDKNDVIAKNVLRYFLRLSSRFEV